MAATEGRKKKRWSLGGLFRRRRGGGASSSDDEVGSRDVSAQFVMARASSWANVTEPKRHRRPEHGSSSDEESCSVTSTSSLNRRSRAARTERYLRRQQQHQQQTVQRAPPTPPERRSSRKMGSPHGDLESALGELEAIYDSLRSAEEEVLPHRSPRPADDMAVRRWTSAAPSIRDSREVLSQAGSYLLLTPTLSPPPPPFPRPLHEPDTTLDDVVFRSLTQRNNSLRVVDPQPPFGIPLGPVSQAPFSDYLHAEPTDIPDDGPDVVLDDLAFRNLRKDRGRSLSASLNHVIRTSRDREVNNNLVDSDSKSDHTEEVPQDLKLAKRMLDIRLKNVRNRIKEQERSGDEGHTFREPHRARYGADGSRYSDLHAAQQRLVIKDEWKAGEKKPSKEELRKRFFAEAYRNLDKAAANFKPPPKPCIRHEKDHTLPPIKHQESSDGYSSRTQQFNGNHKYSNTANVPSALMDYYQLSESSKSGHHLGNDVFLSQSRPPTYRSYSAPQYNPEQMYLQNRSPASSRHNSPGALHHKQESPVRQQLDAQGYSFPSYNKRPNYISYSEVNGETKSHIQTSPKSFRRKSSFTKNTSLNSQEKSSVIDTNGVIAHSKSPSGKHQGSPTGSRHKSTVSNVSPSLHRRKSPSGAPPTSPLSRRKFDPNAESFPKMEHQKQNSPSAARYTAFKQESHGSSRKSHVQICAKQTNEGDMNNTLSSQGCLDQPQVFQFPQKHNSPSSARRLTNKQTFLMKDNETKSSWNPVESLEIKERLSERPPTIGRSEVNLFHNSPTLEELYQMYSSSANDERVVEGEEGRISPSGEEVRRIFEEGEESILLQKLEEEAKATSLMVDKQLQRLAANKREAKFNEIDCRTTFTESKVPNLRQPKGRPKPQSPNNFALFTIDTRAEIINDQDTPDALGEVVEVKEFVEETVAEPTLVVVKSSDESKSSEIDTPTLTEEVNPAETSSQTQKFELRAEQTTADDLKQIVLEDDVDRGSRMISDAVEVLTSLSTSEEGSCYSLDRKAVKTTHEDHSGNDLAGGINRFAGDIDQMRQECDKIEDILSELTRDLERTSPRRDDVLDKVRDDTGNGIVIQ